MKVGSTYYDVIIVNSDLRESQFFRNKRLQCFL